MNKDESVLTACSGRQQGTDQAGGRGVCREVREVSVSVTEVADGGQVRVESGQRLG